MNEDVNINEQPLDTDADPNVETNNVAETEAEVGTDTESVSAFDEVISESVNPPAQEKPSKFNLNSLYGLLMNFIVPLGALVGILLLVFVVIVPSYNNIPLLEAELEEQEALETQLRTKYTKLNTMVDFRSQVNENNELLSTVLTSEPMVPELLTQIDLIARNAGLAVDRLAYSTGENVIEDSDAFSYSIVSVGLSTVGSYSQLISFLADLENAGRLVSVDTVRFTAGGEDGLVTANYTLSSPYVQVETSAVTDDPIAFDITDSSFQELMQKVRSLRIYNITIDDLIELPAAEEEIEIVDEDPIEEPGEEPEPVVEDPLTEDQVDDFITDSNE